MENIDRLVPGNPDSNSTCRKRQLDEPNSQKSLVCKVQKADQSQVSITHPLGTRPSVCEDNSSLSHDQPMGMCAYKDGPLRRCGCKTMNPLENPELWRKFTETIEEVFLPIFKSKQKEINVIFFASGYFLIEANLLEYIFTIIENNNWSGNIFIHFIDLKYKIESNVIVTMDKDGQARERTVGATAGAAGVIVGTAAVVRGIEKNEPALAILGALTSIFSIVLGSEAFIKKPPKKQVQIDTMESDSLNAMEGILTRLSSKMPVKVGKMYVSFLSSVQAYVDDGEPEADFIIGYDIANSIDHLETLRKAKIKDNGITFAAIKTRNPSTNSIVPALIRAKGKEVMVLTKIPLPPEIQENQWCHC